MTDRIAHPPEPLIDDSDFQDGVYCDGCWNEGFCTCERDVFDWVNYGGNEEDYGRK